MNPLQEIHDTIERLLFRIGDEQLPAPEHVSLVVVIDGKVTQYTIQHGTTKQVSVFVTMIDIDVQEEGET